jgi:hypothetical protein
MAENRRSPSVCSATVAGLGLDPIPERRDPGAAPIGKPLVFIIRRARVTPMLSVMLNQVFKLPLLMLFGHGRAGRRCPLSGVQRKSSLDSLPS